MANSVAPPKNTGGGGFVFEDDVCSWFLAAMLVGEPVFGVECGVPLRIDFQTRPDGWFLDDLLVTTTVGTRRHRFALSVKSNAQFTAKSAPADFVKAAWEQWLHIGSSAFDSTLDFIGLVTAPLSGAAAHSVSGLVEKARANDPELLPSRLAIPNWASADELDLFTSFACPASLGRLTTDVDTARLLQRLWFFQRDFGRDTSESQNRTLELCRRAVRSQSAADAQTLWSVLRELASELRPQAGSLTLFNLVDRLRARISLADYPDHGGDWEILDARSRREAGLVRASIADRIRLPRDGQVADLVQSIAADELVALLGASGVGKSALAKAAFEQRDFSGERTFWLDASSLDRAADFGAFEVSLQLRNPLAELLASEASLKPVIIIDGLDRLYADVSFRTVATLLRLAGGGPQATKWRVIAVCQQQEWPRILEDLQRAGAQVDRWRTQQAAALQPEDLQPVRDVVPSLARLLLQPRVGTLFTNLKLLDLVVRRLDGGAEIDASGWVGESSVADWFWNAEVARGANQLARGKFVRSLAQTQADQLVVSVAVDTLDESSLPAAQSLIVDQLLVHSPGDRLAFSHDLYGDWARLRVLLNHRDYLSEFLQTRHESPLWHRAIRLLGIHLLERTNGIAEWKALMASFSDGNLTVVRDLLLEAPAFAMNAKPLLEAIFPDLTADNGELLRRLLTRFLAFSTVPDERMLEIARSAEIDMNAARTAFRRPHWPYWLDLLAVLHAHRSEAVSFAPRETAKVVEMWLDSAPIGTIRRREAADLALMLGERAIATHRDWQHHDGHDDRQRLYKCALLAAPEIPDEVAEFARTAAERIKRTVEETEPPRHIMSHSILGPGVLQGPWPDGPFADVDEDFEHVVLESQSILRLFRVRPAAARETILATLIEAPHEVHWGNARMHERELGLSYRTWHPSFFTRGPFLSCLRENFDEGLELVMRLVEFATERSSEQTAHKIRDWRIQALANGGSEAEIDEIAARLPSHSLLLHDGESEISFSGDAGSYGWSSGTTSSQGYSPLPPPAVDSALMALEQYFYLRLGASEDIADSVAKVLGRTRVVAVLGVLVDVGKRQPSLFEGPLRSLLSSPDLYSWDLEKVFKGRSHLMIGAITEGKQFFKIAQEFHALEHRKHDLRNVATERLFRSKQMREFFVSVRTWWAERRGAGEQLVDIANQLDLWFDPKNYQVRKDPTHGHVIVNVALERARESNASQLQELDDQMLITGFPLRCRRILDERSLQTDVQLDDLWREWLRIRDLARNGTALPGGEERFGDEYINAILGGVAVFLWHEQWLAQEESRRGDLEGAIESILEGELPESDSFDVSTWTWNCFLADAAIMLWARAPQDERWRRLVAELVFSEKYAAVRLLFSRSAEHRGVLGDDFWRLQRLVLEWSHLRERLQVLRRLQHVIPSGEGEKYAMLQEKIASWSEQAITSFTAATLESTLPDWRQFADAERFAEVDALRRGELEPRSMDFHLVRCSHDWLPLPDEATSLEERERVIEFWRIALDVVTARPLADLQRAEHQYPSEDEVWVLDSIAALVLQLRQSEEPDFFCSAIVDLHSEAHDWPERFIGTLHRRALAAEPTPATYEPLVRQLVERALSDVDGRLRWPRHEEVWDALLGIDWRVSDAWSDRHADHVEGISDVLSLWMARTPQDGRRLNKLARWLSVPAAAAVRLDSLGWLLTQVRGTCRYADEAQDALAKLLNVIWDRDQSRLRANHESFAAFRGILAWLVERQSAAGLELQGRIAGLT